MKNVVVFQWAGRRRAIELRYVREIITLGHIARVPGTPQAIGGAVSYHGRVLPVLIIDGSRHLASAGDPAIVIEVGEVLAAIATDGIGEVSTLRPGERTDELVCADGAIATEVKPSSAISAALAGAEACEARITP